MIRKNAKKSQ